ncbi:MAG: TolC family protein [Ignavibacteriales bacterium]|nr:TolC family protein [Ignavibacteriales bacterium]MCB9258380.1 TolC family protein [Ignavibacteriales bacterium]
MKSKLFFFLLIIYAMFSNYSAQENNETLQTLIQKAVEVSPKLKMLEAKKNASEARVSVNSNLPDPTLTLGLMNLPTNSFSFTQEPMTGKMIGLSQAVPYPGKLGAAENVLNKDAEITQEEIDDAKNEIINNIKQAYYDLSFARSALGIAEKSKSNLERISAVVRTKYTVSEASQQNLIQADVELTKIKDKIAELKGKVSSSLSTLNSYLLQNRETQIETENLSAINSVVLNINELNKTAKQNRPFLKGIELEKNKSELMENLADYEYYPNFNFSVQYSQRDKITATNTPLNDFVSFVVGLNLPINYGGKKSAKVQESRIMQKMYANQYDAALQVLNKNFGEALSKIDELKEREKLNSEGLFPQAQQSLKSAMANYQVGKTDFINVLDAQNKVYETETNLYKIRMQYYKQLAQLEFLVGKSLTK